MTTEELAECLGVAKQTVNRWIREKGWKTEKFPGVKGGRARLILIDTQVCEFIQNTPAFHNTPVFLEAEEPLAEYAPGMRTPAYRQIISAGNDSNLLIVFYVQIMPDDFVMQLHRF